MSETKTPDNVAIITSLKPDNIGTGDEQLRYTELQKRDIRYSADLGEYWDALESAEPGSAEEQKAAENLAKLYMLKTAMKIVDYAGNDQATWNERYSIASSELYGRPDEALAASLLESELTALTTTTKNTAEVQELVAFYHRYIPESAASGEQKESLQVAEILQESGEYLRNQYGGAFELIEPDESYDSAAIAALFEQELLPWLVAESANNDAIPDSVGKVRVEVVPGSNFQIDPSPTGDIVVFIGESRPPQKGALLQSVVAHEVMGHVFRGLNGYEAGNPALATGLGGYEVFEEGFGVFLESSILGYLPDHHYDGYVDIALALGVRGGEQPSRSELARISQLRNIVRMQQNGIEPSTEVIDELAQKAQIHVDRMYRGTRGEDSDAVHGVYTKDITYFVGFAKAAQWVADMQERGWEIGDIISYAQQGKMDPTIESHQERIASI